MPAWPPATSSRMRGSHPDERSRNPSRSADPDRRSRTRSSLLTATSGTRTTYDTDFFDLEPGGQALPTPSLVPEFWGDTILANGTAYPFLKVEPRRYRFRILNACNTRFLNLSLVLAAGRTFPDNAEPSAVLGPEMRLIGTEGGFLDGSLPAVEQGVQSQRPRRSAPAPRARRAGGPHRRFSAMQPGQTLILHSDAPVPFPGGPPQADFYPGNPDLVTPPIPASAPTPERYCSSGSLPWALSPATGSPIRSRRRWSLPPSPMPALPPSGTPRGSLRCTRRSMPTDASRRTSDRSAGRWATTTPRPRCARPGRSNLEDLQPERRHAPDSLPLLQRRVLERQATAGGRLHALIGESVPARTRRTRVEGNRADEPGECITLLVEVPPTTGLAPAGVTIPDSPRLAAVGTPGAEYVWHCHILEHEEHDMMRPLVIQEPGAAKPRP